MKWTTKRKIKFITINLVVAGLFFFISIGLIVLFANGVEDFFDERGGARQVIVDAGREVKHIAEDIMEEEQQ